MTLEQHNYISSIEITDYNLMLAWLAVGKAKSLAPQEDWKELDTLGSAIDDIRCKLTNFVKRNQ